MVVSLGIFTVVAVIAIGALLKISDANRKAIILKTSINNLNFALEAMSREMRFGTKFECRPNPSSLHDAANGSCPGSGSWAIAFDSSETLPVTGGKRCKLRYAYWMDYAPGGPSILKKSQEERCDTNSIGIPGTYFEIISPEVRITDSKITLDATSQPRITFWLEGETGRKLSDVTSFSLQTTISQRTPL